MAFEVCRTIVFLPWQLARYCWLLCELVLRNETFLSIPPRNLSTGSECMVASATASYLQFWKASDGSAIAYIVSGKF